MENVFARDAVANYSEPLGVLTGLEEIQEVLERVGFPLRFFFWFLCLVRFALGDKGYEMYRKVRGGSCGARRVDGTVADMNHRAWHQS